MDKCKNCNQDLSLNEVQIDGVHMSCEQEYFFEKTEQMIKVRPEGCSWAVLTPSEGKQVIEELLRSENDEHDIYEFQVVFMSKGEINSLEEFNGW